jgi:hypothetical protein
MNKYQWIAVILAAVNLVLVWLFPPYDYISPARNNVPTFDGFYWLYAQTEGRRVNANFQQIEYFIILINAAIAWLLLRTKKARAAAAGADTRKVDWQRVVLIGVALNLLLVLLFPPMENFYAVTRAALPSFDGFYFIFGEHGARTIVTQLLYLEVIFVLINGSILWLLFRKAPTDLSDAEKAELARELMRARH